MPRGWYRKRADFGSGRTRSPPLSTETNIHLNGRRCLERRRRKHWPGPCERRCVGKVGGDVARIIGVEGMTKDVLARELQRGGKFVAYQYVFSVLVATFRRTSPIYFVAPGESRVSKGLPWTLLTLAVGWWGFPWGFIYTPGAVWKNLSGGMDVTQEVASELLAGFAGPSGAAELPTIDRVVSKRTYQYPDRLACLVTFQRGSGGAVELEVTPEWYEYLNAGDAGSLTLQEGRFWGFEKTV